MTGERVELRVRDARPARHRMPKGLSALHDVDFLPPGAVEGA